MRHKDFYKILDLPVNASTEDVKRAYRKLALKYHPDTSSGGKAAESWFRQIHEAYRTLSDPGRRAAYNQQRWYRESTVSSRRHPPHTPEELLQKCQALKRYTRSMDEHRTNFEALQQYIFYLLSAENLQMLKDWKNNTINNFIVLELIDASRALSYQRFLPVASRLQQVDCSEGRSAIDLALKERKRLSYWKNYQLLYVLLISILLCVFIYFLAS